MLGLQCSELFTGHVSGGSVEKYPGVSPGFLVSSWVFCSSSCSLVPRGRETQPCPSHVHRSLHVLAHPYPLENFNQHQQGAGMTENYIYALLHKSKAAFRDEFKLGPGKQCASGDQCHDKRQCGLSLACEHLFHICSDCSPHKFPFAKHYC